MRSIVYYSEVEKEGSNLMFFVGAYSLFEDDQPTMYVPNAITDFLKEYPLTLASVTEEEFREGMRYIFIDPGTCHLMTTLSESPLEFVSPSKKHEALIRIAMKASIHQYYDIPSPVWNAWEDSLCGGKERETSYVFTLEGGTDEAATEFMEQYHNKVG